MNSVFRRLPVWGFILLLFILPAHAEEPVQAFQEGVRHYRAGEYDAAAAAFKSVVEAGIRNGNLFYNLGNAYFKSGDLGHAILWYERALKLMPDNPDLRFNYTYALSATRDERTLPRYAPLTRILFFWNYLLSDRVIQWLAVGCNLIFWGLLLYRILRRKRLFIPLTCVVLALTVLFTLTAFYNYYRDTFLREGIILPEQVSVRSGLSDETTELFVLHAGSKVRIEREREGHYRIFFSEGKIGWIGKEVVGEI